MILQIAVLNLQKPTHIFPALHPDELSVVVMLAHWLHQATVGPMNVMALSRLHSMAATAEIRGKPHLRGDGWG